MAHSIPVSTGEYLDRMAVLHTKVGRFMGAKRHDALRRLYGLERQLSVPTEKEPEVNALYRQLLDVHRQLFDIEDGIRAAASMMPTQKVGSTDGWFDASVASDVTRANLMKFMQSAHSISRFNEERHQLIRLIDGVVGDAPEPKEYTKAGSPNV